MAFGGHAGTTTRLVAQLGPVEFGGHAERVLSSQHL